VRPVQIRADVAYEYLDDGGVLVCQLSLGAYRELGPPAGAIWGLILDLAMFEEVAAHLPEVACVSRLEAGAALEAFCQSLEELRLITSSWRHPQPGQPL
jgi:hypothetical protein